MENLHTTKEGRDFSRGCFYCECLYFFCVCFCEKDKKEIQVKGCGRAEDGRIFGRVPSVGVGGKLMQTNAANIEASQRVILAL